MKDSFNKNQAFFSFMIKVDRLAAWTLLLVVLLYAFTGYGMTRGFISYEQAASLHLKWLGVTGLTAFTVHAGWAIHLAFKRWRVWNSFSKTLLISLLALLILLFGYLHFFYRPKITTVEENVLQPTDNPKQGEAPLTETSPSETAALEASSPTSVSDTPEPFFTAETLSKYDGQNGQPAYIAVDSLVYDVSSLFINGTHHGCQAGEEVSAAFYRFHLKSVLKGFKVVGEYRDS